MFSEKEKNHLAYNSAVFNLNENYWYAPILYVESQFLSRHDS